MITYIAKLLKALNENAKPGEIAHACCLGVILGLMPKDNALWYLIFILFLFVRINKGAYGLMTLLVSLFAWEFDATFDTLGYAILTWEPLKNIFAVLLDIPFVGFTKFNNTIVTGSLAVGLMAYIPVYVIIRVFVALWRKHITPVLGETALAKALNRISLVQKIYELKDNF